MKHVTGVRTTLTGRRNKSEKKAAQGLDFRRRRKNIYIYKIKKGGGWGKGAGQNTDKLNPQQARSNFSHAGCKTLGRRPNPRSISLVKCLYFFYSKNEKGVQSTDSAQLAKMIVLTKASIDLTGEVSFFPQQKQKGDSRVRLGKARARRQNPRPTSQPRGWAVYSTKKTGKKTREQSPVVQLAKVSVDQIFDLSIRRRLFFN